MFRVKICGITRLEDAVEAVSSGADAVGLNFYPGSPRCVDAPFAAEVTRTIGQDVMRVGVFVNESVDVMLRIAKEAGLSAIQLHGDETADTIAKLLPIPVVLARRLGKDGTDSIASELDSAIRRGNEPSALLVDSAAPGQYGGTGQTARWDLLEGYTDWTHQVPLVLAGGLSPDNVAQAIQSVVPYGVDVASGVESAPGVKDPDRVQRFVSAAKRAFESVG